jgi:SMI1 / KNR4 family (SUKH-1)
MSSLGESLKLYWSARGLRFGPGVPEELPREFEARHGVRLPADMRGYFVVVNGMDAWGGTNLFGWDDDLFRFWPLSEVERASDHYHPDRFLEDQGSFFLFADHSISLPSYAIRLTPEGEGGNAVIAIYRGGGRYETTVVADSFSGFVKRYLADESSRMDLGLGIPLGPAPRPTEGASGVPDGRSHPLWDAELDG